MAYIILNGKKSTMINGLVISTLPPITKPAKRTIIDEIDGRDGNIVQEVGYSAYTKEFEIGLVDSWDIDEIIEYFNSEGTVTFSNELDKYYNYKIIDQIDFEKLGIFRTATIKMLVQPFKYSLLEGILTLDPYPNLIELLNDQVYLDGLTFSTSKETGIVSVKGKFSGTDHNTVIADLDISCDLIDKGNYDFFLQLETNPHNIDCTIFLVRNKNDRRYFGNGGLSIKSSKKISALNNRKTQYNVLSVHIENLYYGKNVELFFYPKLCNSQIAYLKVRNNGNVNARPILTIHGEGKIQVYLNNILIFIINLGNEQKITIDTIKMNAYKDGILKNRLVQGDYDDLILKPGMNVIKAVGNVNLATIENYSRWL